MTPIIVVGALGRMGRAIIELAQQNPAFSLRAGVAKEPSPNPLSCPLYGDLAAALKDTHQERPVIIDFSQAKLAKQHLTIATDFGCGLVMGTTGHPPEHDKAFLEAGRIIPLVVAPNTSLMAVLMHRLCGLAASTLPLSHKAILDIHHAHKKDAPSGTAHALAQAMGEGVSIQSLRLGEIMGEHTAYFVSEFERLEITHRVTDRAVFAQGALVAAQFVFTQEPGLYDMGDVLNLTYDHTKAIVADAAIPCNEMRDTNG